MRQRLIPVLCTLALVAAAAPRPARAATGLGLGADYHLAGRGIFQLTLDVDTTLVRHLSVGGRVGALLASTPTTFGVPVDLYLRLRIRRIYFQGLVGPWISSGVRRCASTPPSALASRRAAGSRWAWRSAGSTPRRSSACGWPGGSRAPGGRQRAAMAARTSSDTGTAFMVR